MKAHPIVGVWRVKDPKAPFPYHMFAFHSDGTMHQSNPPAGNAATSDSAGLGVWSEGHDSQVKARFEEYSVTYDGSQVTKSVVDFVIKVSGNSLTGDVSFSSYYAESGERVKGPLASHIEGTRVTLD